MQQDEALISGRVRGLLDKKSLSGSELARRLDVSQSYVSRRLRGEVPWRATELTRVADIVGVPVTELLAPAQVPA